MHALLQVGELSPAAQQVIAKYTCQMGGLAGRYAPMSAATGVLPWTHPEPEDFDLLAQASVMLLAPLHAD